MKKLKTKTKMVKDNKKSQKKRLTDFTEQEKEKLRLEAEDLYNNIEWT